MTWLLGFLSGSWSWYGAALLIAGGFGFFGYTVRNWRWAAGGILIGALAAYTGTLHGELAARDAKLAEITATNATLTAESEAQRATIARLGEDLQNFVDAGKKSQANSRMWQKKFEESQKTLSATTAYLNGFTIQPNEGDCHAATRMLHDYPRP